jgi:hypothetical protein
MGTERSSSRVLAGTPEEMRPLERTSHRKKLLKRISEK